MKKGLAITLVILVIAGVGLYFGITQGRIEAPGITPIQPTEVAGVAVEPTAIPPVIDTHEINVSGHLVPANYSDLSFLTDGTVIEVLAEEGQVIEKGQVVARLGDGAQVNYEISQAQLDILNAKKAIADLKENAPITAAQARYDMSQVEKDLEKAIKRRQAMEYPKGTKRNIDDAYRKYQAAESNWKEVESWIDSADQEMREVYDMATKEKNNAWANYQFLITPYTEKEKAEQDAVVSLNQQKLDDLKAKYGTYAKGADPQALSIAQAELKLAESRLAIAKANKERLELRAPFAGTVLKKYIKAGQIVSAGQPVLLLVDTSHWHIETEDLTEIGVTRIQEGAEAIVRFDALPDKTFKGKVIDIKGLGELKKGDITYTAVIEIDNTDQRLRWNMTSPVTIHTK